MSSVLDLKYFRVKLICEIPFSCTFCSKYYWDLTQLKYHRDEHEQQSKSTAPEPKCEKCNKTFRNNGSLRKHVRTVCSPRDTNQLYECDICKRKYRLKGALKDHMNKHSRKALIFDFFSFIQTFTFGIFFRAK